MLLDRRVRVVRRSMAAMRGRVSSGSNTSSKEYVRPARTPEATSRICSAYASRMARASWGVAAAWISLRLTRYAAPSSDMPPDSTEGQASRSCGTCRDEPYPLMA
ncbi:MAG: hypothetical protein R2749_07415 [Acidimicrobiales bacterium]